VPTTVRKPQQRGLQSRTSILDAAETLMAARGYAATSISAICKATGLPATSIYHHFGNKQQLLAAVMERGAQRWFDSLPDWSAVAKDADVGLDRLVAGAGGAVAQNPAFLRLFYLLSLDSETDSRAAELIQGVRSAAFRYFESVLTAILIGEYPDVLAAVVERLTPFAVALSDGCFFSLQLEPNDSDVVRMYADLMAAVRALAPQIAATVREGTRRAGG
jgi:AcrR family transcriptional regulator